jgi:hypothetical protein
MPHFVNPSKRYYLSTSLKVLYTLLYHEPALQLLCTGGLDLRSYVRRWVYGWRMPHFLLVRNPYDRLESFYKDKFRQVPATQRLTYDQLQDCQRFFCPFLHIHPDDAPATIREKLLGLSFARFIELLPQVYQCDLHLRPQVMTKLVYYRRRPIASLKIDRTLHMESPDDLRYLQDELGIDLSRKHNSTQTIPLANPWSPELRAIVNKLYRADFQEFGYERWTN